MDASDSEANEGRNPRHTRLNNGPGSIPVGQGYGTLYSPGHVTQHPGQTSKQGARQSEHRHQTVHTDGLTLNLGLEAVTSVQPAQDNRRESKRPSQPPVQGGKKVPRNVVVSEEYLNGLIAQIAWQEGNPSRSGNIQTKNPEKGIDLNLFPQNPTRSASGSSRPRTEKQNKDPLQPKNLFEPEGEERARGTENPNQKHHLAHDRLTPSVATHDLCDNINKNKELRNRATSKAEQGQSKRKKQGEGHFRQNKEAPGPNPKYTVYLPESSAYTPPDPTAYIDQKLAEFRQQMAGLLPGGTVENRSVFSLAI